MPIDVSILKGLYHPKFPDPVEGMQNTLALQHLVRQGQNDVQTGQLNGIALQKAQQGQQDEAKARAEAEAVNQIVIKNRGDLEKSLPEIATAAPGLYQPLADHVAKQKKDELDRQNTQSTITTREGNAAETNRHNLATEKKPTEVSAGATLVPNDQPLPYTAPVKAEKPPNPSFEEQTYEDYKRGPESLRFGTDRIGFDKYKQAQKVEAAKAGRAPAEGSSITPESLDMLATQFAKTGQLPPMGMGAAASNDRKAIFNRAAVLFPAAELALSKADFDANKKSLDGLQKLADAQQAFESTALKNMAPLLASSKKIIDSGSPLINLPLREAAVKLAGSPDQAVYNAALQIVATEYAKIITNPNLSGVLSDSARDEVKALLPASATLKQTVDVLNLLKTDAGNRRSSNEEQIKAIRDRIKGAGGNTTGGISVTDPTGGVHTFKTQADADKFKRLANIK